MIRYLRMEGVNLGNFVYDTNELSTVRGGSFLLLEAVKRVEAKFGLTPITTGASSGIFELKPSDPVDIQHRVARYLTTDAQLRHATFVVDVVSSEDYVLARESLLAWNRWRQMRAPSIAVPSPAPAADRPCHFDRLRPATHRVQKGADQYWASESVFLRRKHGIDRKRRFYFDVTQVDVADGYSEDLDNLTGDDDRGVLHHKMAVIYVDGNGFGDLQRRHCRDRPTHKAFDTYIKERRAEFLKALVEEARDSPGFREARTGPVRLETLMWGGDEFLLVVPAWKGWRTLELFFEVSRNWTFVEKLTHAAGLVFCHHNAPIRRITRLAEKLCGVAKNRAKGTRPPGNCLAYQVLESFDHTGTGLEEFRKRRSPPGVDLILSGEPMRTIRDGILAIKEEFPRSTLHRVAQCLLTSATQVGAVDELRRDALARMTAAGQQAFKDGFATLTELVGGEAALWFHLAELWDYVVTE